MRERLHTTIENKERKMLDGIKEHFKEKTDSKAMSRFIRWGHKILCNPKGE